MVPSKKRTCIGRGKPSAVEKLTKDLYAILQEQQTYLSGSTDEDVLLECDTPTVSVEIGHGSVLIRHPSSIAREEESEASSLSVSNKPCPANEACSQFTTICNHTYNKFDNFSSSEIKGRRLPGQEKEAELNNRYPFYFLWRLQIQETKLFSPHSDKDTKYKSVCNKFFPQSQDSMLSLTTWYDNMHKL